MTSLTVNSTVKFLGDLDMDPVDATTLVFIDEHNKQAIIEHPFGHAASEFAHHSLDPSKKYAFCKLVSIQAPANKDVAETITAAPVADFNAIKDEQATETPVISIQARNAELQTIAAKTEAENDSILSAETMARLKREQDERADIITMINYLQQKGVLALVNGVNRASGENGKVWKLHYGQPRIFELWPENDAVLELALYMQNTPGDYSLLKLAVTDYIRLDETDDTGATEAVADPGPAASFKKETEEANAAERARRESEKAMDKGGEIIAEGTSSGEGDAEWTEKSEPTVAKTAKPKAQAKSKAEPKKPSVKPAKKVAAKAVKKPAAKAAKKGSKK